MGSTAINRLLILCYIGSEALFIELKARVARAWCGAPASLVSAEARGAQCSRTFSHGRCFARFGHTARRRSRSIAVSSRTWLLKSFKSASDNFDTVSPIASIGRSYVYDKASAAAARPLCAELKLFTLTKRRDKFLESAFTGDFVAIITLSLCELIVSRCDTR